MTPDFVLFRAAQRFTTQLLSASLGGAKAVKVEATQEHYLDGRSGAIQLAARAAPGSSCSAKRLIISGSPMPKATNASKP